MSFRRMSNKKSKLWIERKRRKVTQAQLANLLGCSQQWVSFCENNKEQLTPDEVVLICQMWDCKPDDIGYAIIQTTTLYALPKE